MKQKKQMTESEIINALECCAKNPPSCADCNYKGKCNRRDCYDYLKLDALDLINRKNAEAEAMKAHIRLLESENERLKKIINTSAIILPARKCGKTFLIKTTIEKITESARTAARAEAIKEFAEKIYRSCAIYGPKDKFNKVVFLNIVDQIAKEMGCGE